MNKDTTILIIEDNLKLSNVLKQKLELEGYTVTAAENGKEAIDKVHEHKPDIILLDIIMPEKNGFQFLKDLRKEYGNETPVIVLSNLGQEADIKKALELGADDYLIKAHSSLKDAVDKVERFSRPPEQRREHRRTKANIVS